MDGLKELVEAFSARIKSPIIGSIVLAFVIVNWKPLFFLLFSGAPAVTKFAFYDGNMTGYLPYASPVIIGLAFALLLPWVNFWGAKAVEAPITWHRNMQLDAAHAEAEKKTRHAIDMETVSAEYRRVLLESAKVDQEIKEADIDEDVRTDLEERISVDLTALQTTKASPSNNDRELLPAAEHLLVHVGKHTSGRFSVSDFEDKHVIVLGRDERLNFKDREQYLDILEAIQNLKTLGYVDGNGTSGRITKEGYKYLSSIPDEDT